MIKGIKNIEVINEEKKMRNIEIILIKTFPIWINLKVLKSIKEYHKLKKC